MRFDPVELFGGALPEMRRPDFWPIISSNLLAEVLVKRLPKGSIQGFVVERPTAGGHNAPPRKPPLDEDGNPLIVYGLKDEVNWKKLADLEIPFWIGGSCASPQDLSWAKSVEAVGIQVGGAFALCEESGMKADLKAQIRRLGFEGKLRVKTDGRISPTGFPFKVIDLPGTISDPAVYANRERVCDQGALLILFTKPDGSIGYRCPGETVTAFVNKGGDIQDTTGRGCICNGLYATAGLGDGQEPPLVTLGDDVSFLKQLMAESTSSYTAGDVITYLLSSSGSK